MKKVWAIALVTVLCITVLTGCKSNADMSVNAGSDADSQVVSEEMSENIENKSLLRHFFLICLNRMI